MADEIVARVEARYLDDEVKPKYEAIKEMVRTIEDRLLIRLDTDKLPAVAESIVVDAAVKALRLRGYEGSTSESSSDGGSISNSFVDDVLAAYSEEIDALHRKLNKGKVKFIKARGW